MDDLTRAATAGAMEQAHNQHEKVKAREDVVSLEMVESVFDDDLPGGMAILRRLSLRSDCWQEDKESHLKIGPLALKWGG